MWPDKSKWYQGIITKKINLLQIFLTLIIGHSLNVYNFIKIICNI